MKAKPCPFCNRILQNRLFDNCSYCGNPLPPEYCLSDVEKEDLKIKKRHQFRQVKKSYDFHNRLYIRTINAHLNDDGVHLIEPPESDDA